MIPTSIDGTDITGATIDGQEVQEITVDGDTVFTAAPNIPDSAILHVDASQESFDNDDSVTTITDFSGEGNDLSGGSPTFKTGQINGNPVFRFNGSSDALTSAGPTTSQGITVFVVVEHSDTSGNQALLSSEDDGADRAHFSNRFDNGDVQIFAADGPLGGGTPIAGPQIATAVLDGSSSLIRIDGSEIASGTAGGGDWGGFRLGNRYGDQWYIDGDVGEVVFCDVALTSQEIDDEEQRLADKWGVSI